MVEEFRDRSFASLEDAELAEFGEVENGGATDGGPARELGGKCVHKAKNAKAGALTECVRE